MARDEDNDDHEPYPYTDSSPNINKPISVNINSAKRFASDYGTDNEVERIAVKNLSDQSIKGAERQRQQELSSDKLHSQGGGGNSGEKDRA
jgi:hypothetical protein|mmetsp:Transcript_23001/g.30592  ORF Transcript_23001/g.30592 Transcript_23001/m.30592 type:complete len:91 (+) Transcript_23001:2977-3249(+)|eukprot:CAMPEP_0185602126 /NCGR_PEP_ID=MMETSP0436-20130131/1559_1 /TAXON_ID=626734 ORGANISM="Favella taraikaensis, Strain Fe Narragansett Bay" /NCGR_SAMPLE_ID=MMETSP0436 /ASSEMBLY_ACC=CAM_ASM_000390 /LENGTH=90 /DNA_ID=CAMNT_0028232235 /DNA_START=1827 /DNA_END=2099 /DNA_ORIENTATION=-